MDNTIKAAIQNIGHAIKGGGFGDVDHGPALHAQAMQSIADALARIDERLAALEKSN
jgi:hypothetical protein